jgi:hypothetical protein
VKAISGKDDGQKKEDGERGRHAREGGGALGSTQHRPR